MKKRILSFVFLYIFNHVAETASPRRSPDWESDAKVDSQGHELIQSLFFWYITFYGFCGSIATARRGLRGIPRGNASQRPGLTGSSRFGGGKGFRRVGLMPAMT